MSINEEIFRAAQWVSERIKVPAEIIYSQWAMEQPEAITDPAGYKFNLAGLTKKGVPGEWREYESLKDFADDYTYKFLLPLYPGTYGKSDVWEFVEGLKAGVVGSYFGKESVESYGGKVKSVYDRLFGGGQPQPVAVKSESYFERWKKYTGMILRGKIKEAEEYRAGWEIAPGVTERDVSEKAAKKVEEGNSWIVGKLNSIFFVVAGVALLVVGLVIMVKEGGK